MHVSQSQRTSSQTGPVLDCDQYACIFPRHSFAFRMEYFQHTAFDPRTVDITTHAPKKPSILPKTVFDTRPNWHRHRLSNMDVYHIVFPALHPLDRTKSPGAHTILFLAAPGYRANRCYMNCNPRSRSPRLQPGPHISMNCSRFLDSSDYVQCIFFL
jgi:hypothetical protein